MILIDDSNDCALNLMAFVLPTLFARCVPSPGYEDMEAQFAWDDKTIRQTFIRKVRCRFSRKQRKNKPGTKANNQHWRLPCRSTPSSWSSCSSLSASSPSSHSGESCSLFFTLFFYTLTHDNGLVVVCLPSAPVRFFIQTHPGLYMAS